MDSRSNTQKSMKMTNNMKDLIEEIVRLDWSPEQISGWIACEDKLRISY